MTARYQRDVLTLIMSLLGLMIQPATLAAAPFFSNRSIHEQWMPILATAGLLWTTVVSLLALIVVDSHIDVVGRRLHEMGAKQYGLRGKCLRQAFALCKFITFALPLSAMFLIGALNDPAGLGGTRDALTWVATSFALSGWIFAIWTKVTLGRCDVYSWTVWTSMRKIADDSFALHRVMIGFPTWMVRLETVVFCCAASVVIFAATRVVDVWLLATTAGIVNVVYFVAFHLFLIRAYKRARREHRQDVPLSTGTSDRAPAQGESEPPKTPPIPNANDGPSQRQREPTTRDRKPTQLGQRKSAREARSTGRSRRNQPLGRSGLVFLGSIRGDPTVAAHPERRLVQRRV